MARKNKHRRSNKAKARAAKRRQEAKVTPDLGVAFFLRNGAGAHTPNKYTRKKKHRNRNID